MELKPGSLGFCCALLSVGAVSDVLPSDFHIRIDNLHGLGGFVWAHDASSSNPTYGDPTSELAYKNSASNVLRLSISAPMPNERLAHYWVSSGQLAGGSLRDKDWYSDAHAEALVGPTLFSDTTSDLNSGDYFDIGLSISQPVIERQTSTLWWVFDASYVTEQLHAYGATLLADPYADYTVSVGSELVPSTQAVISQEFSFASLGIGIRAEWAPAARWLLSMQGMVRPLVSLYGEDVHHLRTDLGRPSVIHRGVGGGVAGTANLTYMITDRWAAILGIESTTMALWSGNATLYTSTGYPTQPYPLRSFDYHRAQWQLGVQYRLTR